VFPGEKDEIRGPNDHRRRRNRCGLASRRVRCATLGRFPGGGPRHPRFHRPRRTPRPAGIPVIAGAGIDVIAAARIEREVARHGVTCSTSCSPAAERARARGHGVRRWATLHDSPRRKPAFQGPGHGQDRPKWPGTTSRSRCAGRDGCHVLGGDNRQGASEQGVGPGIGVNHGGGGHAVAWVVLKPGRGETRIGRFTGVRRTSAPVRARPGPGA